MVTNLIEIRGIGISGKKTSGLAYLYQKRDKQYHDVGNVDVKKEKKRLNKVIAEAETEVECILQAAKSDHNEAWSIFETHKLLLEDVELKKYICELIDQEYDLLSALIRTKDDMKSHFLNMESEIFRTKVSDIEDVFERMIKLESGNQEIVTYPEAPFILICDDILPSMVYQLPIKLLKGIIVKFGSNCSHGAILARTKNIPVIIRLKNRIDLIKPKQKILMNGESGAIFLLDD
jgi:phosphotransferase system enzyme I (PtsI)